MSNSFLHSSQIGRAFGLLALCISGVVPGDEWPTVICAPLDLPPDAMFEVVKHVDRFEAKSIRWEAISGGQNARCELSHDVATYRSGTGAMSVEYRFDGTRDLEYVQLRTPLEIAQRKLAFGFWLKQKEELPIRLRVTDRSGETHQLDLLSNKTSDWQFVVARLDGPGSSWGGDENHRCDFPCRLEGIVFDRIQRGFKSSGRLWIDDVSLLRERPTRQTLKIATLDARFGNLYALGESVDLRITGEGDRLEWRWTDFWGRVLARGDSSDGTAAARLKLTRPGYFSCHIEVQSNGRLTEAEQFCCAALPVAKQVGPCDFVGVCSHYGQNNYPLPSMDLMRDYGIDQFRDEISWRSFERRRGNYELPAHADAYLTHARRLKMRPLIIYDYSNPLYDNDGFPNSTEAINAFADYAVNLTRKTRDTVAMFEIWNEWIGGCGMRDRGGDHGPEAYGRLQKATFAAVKKEFPEVKVVGIGGEYGADCSANIVAALNAAGADSMDAWSIHPYRYPRSPEATDLVSEIGEIADQVRQTGAQQKAWITEIGWPTHRTARGSTETMQARYCVRSLVLLQATGLVEKVFWYDFKDDGIRRDYNEHNFGLVRHQTYNCAPKPSIVAMSVFIRMAGEARFEDLQSAGPLFTARYQLPDGAELLVAWSAADALNVTISGKVDGIVDIMGASRTISDVVQATSDPIYVYGKDLKIQ